MKVGFIGVGGTGKTTTLEGLFTMLPKIKSVIRPTFEEWGVTEEGVLTMDPQRRWGLQKLCFDRKLALDITWHTGIAERTILDHLMYCLYYCSREMGDSAFSMMETLVRANLDRYQLLLYFPFPEVEVPSDGFRNSGRAIQVVQDLILQGLIERFKLKVKRLEWEDRVERSRKVDAMISSMKGGK